MLPEAARVGVIPGVALSEGAPYLGIRWSPVTSRIDTRAVHGGNVRAFLADLRAVPVDASATEYMLDAAASAVLLD